MADTNTDTQRTDANAGVAGDDRPVIRIGTRGSELATTQAGHVRDALIRMGHEAELVIVKTAGDANRHDPVEKIGIGVFTQACATRCARTSATSPSTPSRTCPPRRKTT